MQKWQETNLGQYVKVQGVPVIKIKNVRSRYIDMTEADCVSNAVAESARNYFLNNGDVVISMTGSGPSAPNSVVGRVARYTGEQGRYVINQRVGRLTVRDASKIDKRFLFFLLSQKEVQDWLVSNSTGSANQANISGAQIESLRIVLPPITEQRAIAAILGALDDKIEMNQQMNKTLEAIAMVLFKSWFVDFDPVKAKAEGNEPEGIDDAIAALFPSSFIESPLGPIPHGWRIGDIKDLCQRVESGGTPSRKERAYWDNGTIPWLTSSEVRQKVILDAEEKITERGLAESSARIWPSMSTVVAMYGATAGQVTLLANSVSANQACCALIPKPYTQSFVFLKAARSVEIYERQARGSAQQNLNKSIVSELKTIIPPQKILEAFENVVGSLIVLIIQGVKENMTLSELRDHLLPRLISGNLRVEEVSETVEALAL